MDCFGNAESYVWRWISMYSIALKNDSLIDKKLFWECGKMSMENVEIFSWGSRSLSTESSPPPFQRLQANQIVPLTCIRLVFFIPLLHICLVFFTQYFSRQRLVTDYYFKYFNKKHNLKVFFEHILSWAFVLAGDSFKLSQDYPFTRWSLYIIQNCCLNCIK